MNEETTLSARIDAAEKEAHRGCGLSYELYEKRVQAAYAEILASVPESEREEVEQVLRSRGYDPDFEPYKAGPGECDLTGIEVDCCPCGGHP